MNRQFCCLLALILFWAMISCTKTEVKSDLAQNIRIKMLETVDSVKKVLHFRCQTDSIYPCSNFGIEASYTLTNDKITINFSKVLTSDFCLLSPGPASIDIGFAGLSNKTYEVELNFGITTVTGQIVVTSDNYLAVLPANKKVQFVNTDLKRLQDNTIFGRVGFISASSAPIAQTFIDTLQQYGATQAFYLAGDYTDFQIDTNGQIKTTQDGYPFRQNFILKYSKNSTPLKDLVKRFGSKYPGIWISLNTTRGESFYSWVP